MEKIKKHAILLILLTIGTLAFLRGILFLDPDFGWHIKAGELILQNGIQRTDPFSYTMPSFAFIDHEWLINVLMFFGYKYFGIYLLSFVFSLIFVFSLFISIPSKVKNYSLIPLILAGVAILNFSGVRTQVVTWFFLSILIRIILNEKLWKKWRYFLPLIFIPWVNLHGGFAIGIVILFVTFVLQLVQRKKLELSSLGIIFSSTLFTFANPYGLRIWEEIINQITDSSLRFRIAEWLPSFFFVDFAFLFLLTLSFIFMIRYWKKFPKTEIVIYIFLLLLALSSIRHIPLWVLIALPMTSQALFFFAKEIKRDKIAQTRYDKAKVVLGIFALCFAAFSSYQNFNAVKGLSEKSFYPEKAVEYLNSQKISGRLLSIYDYGGYLIWKIPNQKVFIDGRMPSWKREGSFPGESNNAFSDAQKMFSDEEFMRESIGKYDVEYILLPKTKKIEKSLAREYLENFDRKLFGVKKIGISSSDLLEIGFEKIYDDGKFVIFKRTSVS